METEKTRQFFKSRNVLNCKHFTGTIMIVGKDNSLPKLLLY